ncbi:MAG: nitrous oxide reductase accessory protein NosL [Azoarcus sp.]|jgi:nitrous oxide reductase accessory protein NosL|nr:nitrous oxide reductase accessory protein NosL [Azoarcus sp.]
MPSHIHTPTRDCSRSRRNFLVRTSVLPLLPGLLAACGDGGRPKGMTAIHWDRDTCSHCKMAISDHRFAVELRGGPADTVFKFDDIGCLVKWAQQNAAKQPWVDDADVRMWIANFTSPNRNAVRWLDPRQAYYIGRSSPMGHNFAAVDSTNEKALGFEEIRQHILAKGME